MNENLTKGQKTRLRIMKAAIKEFSKEGFYGASVQKIADRAEVSQASVFKHFESKTGLLEALRKHTTEQIYSFVDGKMQPQMTAWDKLEAYMLGNLEWVLKNRDLSQIIVLNYYFGCFDKNFRSHIQRSIERAEGRLDEFLYACQREGYISKESSVTSLSQHIHNYLMGYAIKLMGSTKTGVLDKKIAKQSLEFLRDII